MAASTPHIDYPLKLSSTGVLTLDVMQLKQHLTQQLNYSQTEASTLVDEITSAVRVINWSALHTAVRKAPHLMNFMLQSVGPSERLRFIKMQAGGAGVLYSIFAKCHQETFRQILQSVSSDDEMLQLLQMTDSPSWTVLHDAAYYSATETVQRF